MELVKLKKKLVTVFGFVLKGMKSNSVWVCFERYDLRKDNKRGMNQEKKILTIITTSA